MTRLLFRGNDVILQPPTYLIAFVNMFSKFIQTSMFCLSAIINSIFFKSFLYRYEEEQMLVVMKHRLSPEFWSIVYYRFGLARVIEAPK